MKATIIAASLLSAVALAAPAPEPIPEALAEAAGGYGKYEHYGSYPQNPKGYGSYNNYGGGKPPSYGGGKPPKGHGGKGPIPYTSTYSIKAVPGEVVDSANVKTGGQPGAVGYYDYGINSDYNLICYHIRLTGLGNADYQSLAKTSTHIHEAAKGLSGPPRIAFPNPQPLGNDRLSVGCLQGPFTTGLTNNATGQDTGAGFHVRQIEQNPSAFFTDVHTTVAVPGAVRGQFPGRRN